MKPAQPLAGGSYCRALSRQSALYSTRAHGRAYEEVKAQWQLLRQCAAVAATSMASSRRWGKFLFQRK